MTRLLLSLCIATISIFSQVKLDKKKNFSNVRYIFSLPIYEAVHPESLKVVCYAEIPFNSIQFVKQKIIFLAFIKSQFGIKNFDGIDLNHLIITDTVKILDYADTESYFKE